MTQQPANTGEQAKYEDPYIESQQGPGLVDAIRFFYLRRIRLALYILVIFAVCAIAYLTFYLFSARTVEGTLGLNFRGIEKSEYPSGKRFNVEDFRSPDVLSKALADAGIPAENIPIRELAAHVFVTPAIPEEIQNRWRKQDKDGSKREGYFPNEFKIAIESRNLNDAQRLRLFDALVSRYQERVKYDQKSALAFLNSQNSSYEKLANNYDYWDIPELFREDHQALSEHLESLIAESIQYQDSKYQLSFREIVRGLDTWERTRLRALEALTYQGQLVRNRDMMMQRIQYRIQDLDIQIQQKSQEANDAMRLLDVIERPKAVMAGQLNGKDGVPLIDAGALDKLIKSDYVGPVVQRISKLQGEIRTMEADKARMEKRLSWLPKYSNAGQLPSGYKELITALSSELDSITKNYNQLLEQYLTATITNLVVVMQPPIIVTTGYSFDIFLVAIAFVSFFLALILMGIQHLFQKARENPQGSSPAK